MSHPAPCARFCSRVFVLRADGAPASPTQQRHQAGTGAEARTPAVHEYSSTYSSTYEYTCTRGPSRKYELEYCNIAIVCGPFTAAKQALDSPQGLNSGIALSQQHHWPTRSSAHIFPVDIPHHYSVNRHLINLTNLTNLTNLRGFFARPSTR